MKECALGIVFGASDSHTHTRDIGSEFPPATETTRQVLHSKTFSALLHFWAMASGRPVCAKTPPQLLTPSYAYHIHVTTKGLNGNQVCKIPHTSLNLPDDAHGEKARDVKWDKVTDCSPDR